MKEIIKKYWSEFKKGTKTMFKEFFNRDTNKKQRANMWTFTRLITPALTLICSIIAILTASIPLFITTSVIAGFGALTDKFDGSSARKYQSFSEYGKILDQITDKTFAGIIGINLLFLNLNYLFVLLGEAVIALVNVSYKSKYKDLSINSTMIGRVKQFPLFISLALGFLSTINPTLLLISNISIILTVLFQLATAASYIKSNSESVKKIINNTNTNNLSHLEEDFNKNNKLEKTIGEKEINNNTNNKNISKKDLYINLRNVLNEIVTIKENENINDIEIPQMKLKK